MSLSPVDFGPIYAETDMTRFPVEPWNTASNFIFLALVMYWSWKTRLNFRRYKLLVTSLPILLTGYIGGTVYHATRSSNLWLVLDIGPISLLCIMASYHYWIKILHSTSKVFLFVFGPFVVVRGALFWLPLDQNLQISIGYLVLSLIVIVPLIIHAVRGDRKLRGTLAFGLCAFLLAVVFRFMDDGHLENLVPLPPTGTHWLWHVFGGLATHSIINFVYLDTQAATSEA